MQFQGRQVVRTSVSAVVTRADGTVEDLGEIAATDYENGEPKLTPLDRFAGWWSGLKERLKR